MPSDLTDDKLENVAIPDISQFIGSEELAEHLGIALKEGYNGSINAHININARILYFLWFTKKREKFKLNKNFYLAVKNDPEYID